LTTVSYRIGVDIGGTFTDVVVLDEETGALEVAKSSTTHHAPADGVLSALKKKLTDLSAVSYVVHGTTAATNAVIERRGARVGLVTTQGFRDVLEIMRGDRRYHYDLQWDQPVPLVPRELRFEVPERVDYRGRVIVPLDESEARAVARRLREAGVEAIAICFLFSFMNTTHETIMKQILKEECPEALVSVSSELLPEIREYERTSTVVIDAYVKPLMERYLRDLEKRLTEQGLTGDLMIITSGGGTVRSDRARQAPVHTLMSGPAGGAVGSTYYAGITGYSNVLAADMGGTSFDICLLDQGSPRFSTENSIEWGIPFKAPMVDIKSIGAGGGSIAWIDQGGRLKVGPQSAGAEPGPACYSRGGTEPTVTDAYVVLGVIDPEYFLGGELKLDKSAAEEAVADRVGAPLGLGLVDAARGIVQIAHANMAGALYELSVRQGYDPRDFSLLAYGGAGPMVADALAQEFGVPRVIVPLYPGAFSAFGMLTADLRSDSVRSHPSRASDADMETINEIYQELEEQGVEGLRQQGYTHRPTSIRWADMRYVGQNWEVRTSVPGGRRLTFEDIATIVGNFNMEHDRLYGHSRPGEPVEFINLRVTTVGTILKPGLRTISEGGADAGLKGSRSVYFPSLGKFVDCPIYERDRLGAGARIIGPAIVEEMDSTVLVEPNHEAWVDGYGTIIIEHAHGVHD
jgi:N-methylhydantoinase A